MDVMIEDAGPCRKLLRISAAPEAVAKDYEEVVSTFHSAGRLPGFRKGKAPRSLVARRFNAEIGESLKERLIPRFYREALDGREVTVLAVVGVRDARFDPQTGLTFDVLLDVPPTFKLPRYRKLTLKREETAVTDAQVDEAFANLLDAYATFETATDGVVGGDDFVKIDYTATLDGRPLSEAVEGVDQLAQGEGFWVAMGGEREFIPGLSDAVKGASPGDSRTFQAQFPDDYTTQSAQGLTVDYTATVTERRVRRRPELTDEFLKQFEVDSETALRDRVRRDLEQAADSRETARLKDEIGKHLLSKVDFDLPQTVVEQETQAMVRTIVENVVRQGASEAQVREQRDRIVESASLASRDRVKLTFILGRIAEEEGITVSDEDVSEALAAMAARYGMQPDQLKADLEKRNSMERLRSDLRDNKTMDFLLGEAKIK